MREDHKIKVSDKYLLAGVGRGGEGGSGGGSRGRRSVTFPGIGVVNDKKANWEEAHSISPVLDPNSAQKAKLRWPFLHKTPKLDTNRSVASTTALDSYGASGVDSEISVTRQQFVAESATAHSKSSARPFPAAPPPSIKSPSAGSATHDFAPATPSSLRTVSTPVTEDHVPADEMEDFTDFLRGPNVQRTTPAPSFMTADPRYPREESSAFGKEPVPVPLPKSGRKVKTEKKVLVKEGYAVEHFVSAVDPESPGLPSADLADQDPDAWDKCIANAKHQVECDLKLEHKLAAENLEGDNSPNKHHFYDDKRNAYEEFQKKNLLRTGQELALRVSQHFGLELKDISQTENCYRQLGKSVRDLYQESDPAASKKIAALLKKFFKKAENNTTDPQQGQTRPLPRKFSLPRLRDAFKRSPKPTDEVKAQHAANFFQEVEEEPEQGQPQLRDDFDGRSSFDSPSIYTDPDLVGLRITTVETGSPTSSPTTYPAFSDDPAKAISPPSFKPAWASEHFNQINPGPRLFPAQIQSFKPGSRNLSGTPRGYETRDQEVEVVDRHNRNRPKAFIIPQLPSRASIHSGNTEYVDNDEWESDHDELIEEANAAGTTPQLQQYNTRGSGFSPAEMAMHTISSARDRGSIMFVPDRGQSQAGPTLSRTQSKRKEMVKQLEDAAARRQAKKAGNVAASMHPMLRSRLGDAPTPTRSALPDVHGRMGKESPRFQLRSTLRSEPPKYGGHVSPGKDFTPVKDQSGATDGSDNLNAAPLPLPRPDKLAPSVISTPSERESTTAQADSDQYQHLLDSQPPLEDQIDTMMDKWNKATPDTPSSATFGERRESKLASQSLSGLQHLRYKLGIPPLQEKGEADRPHPNHPYVWDTMNIMCFGIHNAIPRESSTTTTTTTSSQDNSPLARFSAARQKQPATPSRSASAPAPTTQQPSKCTGKSCFYCGCTCCYYRELEQISTMTFSRDPAIKAKISLANSHLSLLRGHSSYQFGIENYDTNLLCSGCERVFCPEHGSICEYLACRAPLCWACKEDMGGTGGYCEEHFLVSPGR